MKSYRIVLIILCFAALSCSNSDDRNFFQIVNENVVFVDNDQSIFEQGDYLWLNIDIPSRQTDKINEKPLDIYELTKANETFFGFSVFAADGDSFTPLRFEASEIVIEKGHLNVVDSQELENTELLGVARQTNKIYEMRVGIPLKNRGEFFLANSGMGSGTQSFAFNTTNGSDIQISLTTKIRDSNSEGRYYFTVN